MIISKKAWNSGFVVIIAVLIALLLFDALVVVAQESEATAEAPPPIIIDETGEYIPVDNATSLLLNNLLNAIAVTVYLPSAAGFTLILTNVSKWLIPNKVPSRFIQLFWMILLWAIFAIASSLGYSEAFNLLLNKVTEIGYIMLGGSLTQIVASSVYDKAAAKKLPLTGYKRPD